MLLSASILEDVSAEAASELTGDGQAAAILPALARTNAFVQPIGHGRYRYHALLREVLRLKLRHQYPNRVALLHRRAAPSGSSGTASSSRRYGTRSKDGDRQLAASMIIGKLAIGGITDRGMTITWLTSSRTCRMAKPGPSQSHTWSAPRSRCPRAESAIAALKAAESILDAFPMVSRPGWPRR